MTFLGFLAVWLVISFITAFALGAFIRVGKGPEEDAA